MKTTTLRIATRKSPMALWQAEFIKKQLETLHSHLKVELLGMMTEGDIKLASPLNEIGGKGLFVKELQTAILEHRADMAVHSIKDVNMEVPDALHIAVYCKRDDPRDVFISNHYHHLDELPKGACVGTSSLRRQCQLKAKRPDLNIALLRGNVNTRLRKLDDGNYDAIVLSAAGLKRLGLQERIKQHFDPEHFLPAPGQGTIGIECRIHDETMNALVSPLNHQPTRYCIIAERAMSRRLGGGCQVPIGAYATLNDPTITLRGMVGRPDGTQIIRGEISGPVDESEKLGTALAEELLAKGAKSLLKGIINYV